MDVDEPMVITPREGSSRASSRSSNRRSPMPPPPAPGTSGITLNRPLGLSGNNNNNPFATLPRGSSATTGSSSGGSSSFRDYSCPPPSRSSGFCRNRSGSGIFISSMFGSRFRHLQKLHSDAFVLGLNAVCYPGLPMGTMFRSSLPATPVSTPIHREPFTQFTEQALRERLCKTPSPRKGAAAMRHFSPLDVNNSFNNCDTVSLHSVQFNLSHGNNGNQPLDNSRCGSGSDQPMDFEYGCPATPIENIPESPSDGEITPDDNSQHNNPSSSFISSSTPQQQQPPQTSPSSGRPPSGPNRKLFGSGFGYRVNPSDPN